MSIAPAGSTIILREGTYRTSADIRKKVIFQPYPNEKVWFKGSTVLPDSSWIVEGDIWRYDNWNFSFPPLVGSEYIDPLYPVAGYRDMVFLNEVPLKQVLTKAEVLLGTFYVDSLNKKLYLGSNPIGSVVEATNRQTGLTIHTNTTTTDTSGTIIRGIGFAHYASSGIGVGSHNVTLENIVCIRNGFEGISLWGGEVAVDCVLRNNIFSYNGSKGLSGSKVHRMLLENNVISHNNLERFSQRWDAAGVKVVKTDGLIWRNNLVEDNLCMGMWIDISSINSTVVGNTVRNNERYGVFLELSHKAIIASNLIYDNLSGIHLTNSSAAKIYNNTLARNGHNLHIDDQDTRRNTVPEEIAVGATWVARDNIVKNNLLSSPAGKFPDTLQFQATNTEPNAQPMFAAGTDSVNNNGYYRDVIPTRRSFRWTVSSQNRAYDTISSFRTATGYESTALFLGDVTPNPLFLDEANHDYTLKPNSAARNKGVPLPVDVALAIGVPAGVPVNLGVFYE